MSPKQVVEEGREFGIGFTEQLVYTVRYHDRKKQKKEKVTVTTTGDLKTRVLTFCIEYVREHRTGPTVKEIRDATGGTTGGVGSTLHVLKKEGVLDWASGNYASMTIDAVAKRRLPPKGGTSNGTIVGGLLTSPKSDLVRADVLALKDDLTEQFEALQKEFETKIQALDQVLGLLP